MKKDFTLNVISVIRDIPSGKVVTYGQVAFMAGNPYGARQVSWILNSFSKKEGLPWHRVVNGKGKISLAKDHGYEEQMYRLKNEGIEFDKNGKIDLGRYLWQVKDK
ncbi:MAG: MGMT family protein [Acidobacteriota bacterium]